MIQFGYAIKAHVQRIGDNNSKELEEENRRLKKMYAEEKLKAEIVREALEKKW